MHIELVTIGNELLLGFTVDTNGAEIARALSSLGVDVVRRTAVPDRAESIAAAVAESLRRTGAVLTTGGLGPTRDDISKTVVAELYGAPLEFDPTVWSDIVARFARVQRSPAVSNRSQAEVPRGATVLRNQWGTAPGLWLEGPLGLTIMLPGVPSEMRKLLELEVAPRLAARASGAVVRSLVVRTTAIAESALAERMGEIEREIMPLSLAYLPGIEGVDLRVTAWGLPADEADRRLRAAADLMAERAGEHAYGEGDSDLAAVLLERARRARLSLGTAESCTGGLVGGRITEVPGSSDVFAGGVVCYSNHLKTELLGVPPELIAGQGAVSEAVARAMAEGARARIGVDVAVSVTGIAGPSGGTEEKPVGTVWFAVASPGQTESRRVVFLGSRKEIRERAAQTALFLVNRRLIAD
ncbi:MAG: competence/damage-inducible protein A [Gemmatimonadales bacterium]|nr:competence/damage-inducible protein A [Gemmatimonadales bacterium]